MFTWLMNLSSVITLMNFSKKYFSRVWFDILSLLLVFLTAFFLPDWLFPVDAKMGFITLFLVKFFSVSAGIIHAHISRKLIFPYIKFSTEETWSNNLMIIAWYVVIIFAWAKGG